MSVFKLGLSVIISFCFLFPMSEKATFAATGHPEKVIRISITDHEKEVYYAYISPNYYLYRVGNQEISGPQAKTAVLNVIDRMPLSADTTSQQLVRFFESDGYPNIQAMTIRWVDQEDHLYTWVWKP